MNEILIYGEIGTDVKDSKVVADLGKFSGEPVTVRVSSGGGDAYAGIAIMNALRAHDGEITAIIEGYAASAASYIAIGGGDRVIARPNAEIMIHSAWVGAAGNADDFTRIAADLARISDNVAGIYLEKASTNGKELTLDEFREMMRAETWFSANEALEIGLVDSVEDARKPVESQGAMAMASLRHCRYKGRAYAPTPEIFERLAETPSDSPGSGQERESMSILNQLARELGKSPEDVQNALSGFFNEAVKIQGEVEVSYPDDVTIVPTERIKVEPIVGDKREEPTGDTPVDPAEGGEATRSAAVDLAMSSGMTFEMGDVADGFTAEVDASGVVTIVAPSGAEVGSVADFTVIVNGTAVPLSVKVRSLSEGAGDAESDGAGGDSAADAPEPDPAPEAPANKVTLDIDTFNELREQAALGAKAHAEQKAEQRKQEVRRWVSEGRISAAIESKALALAESDMSAARELYGSNPKGTIPRRERGYASTGEAPKLSGDPKTDRVQELIDKANKKRSERK